MTGEVLVSTLDFEGWPGHRTGGGFLSSTGAVVVTGQFGNQSDHLSNSSTGHRARRSPCVSDAGDLLRALAVGLAADTSVSGRKALEVLRKRSPDLFVVSEQSGEDLVPTSAGFIDVLLASLRTDSNLPCSEYEKRA